ncbi:hypothetical protein K440DRAFT_375311 [Wilcoxina mikolae CBS 423.85]|nr:hypothetical protein K440DRAFT_375311 [Wilcoxina mikolae CBS 423.85]
MEFAGLAMGGAGLVGLFTTTLEIFDRISAAKAYGERYELFISQLELERARLLIWGRDGRHERLEDPIIRRNVGEILGWLKDTLEKAETMKKRYGLQDQGNHEQENRGLGSSLTISRVETVTADITISSPERRARETHGKASTWRKLRWSISGQKKTLELLNDLRGFINSLYELVPVVADVESALFDAIQRHVDTISLQHPSLLSHTNLPPRTAPPFQRTVTRYRSVYRTTLRRVQQPRGGGPINRHLKGIPNGVIKNKLRKAKGESSSTLTLMCSGGTFVISLSDKAETWHCGVVSGLFFFQI